MICPRSGGSDTKSEIMSITAHDRTRGDAGAMGRLPMLASPLAALSHDKVEAPDATICVTLVLKPSRAKG